MIARALENTLVDRGGQLLPPYVFQLVPDFSFGYQSEDQLAFLNNGSIVRQQSHRDLLEWGFGFRIGLPWETQVGFRVPFDLDYGTATFGGTNTFSSNRGGLGDVSLTLQKQVLHEKGWIPDLLVNLNYTAATGSTSLSQRQLSTFPFAVGTGSGFNSLGAGVTALKRQDPLVFLGGLQYTHSFPSTISGIQQTLGDQVLLPRRSDPGGQPGHFAACRLADDVPTERYCRRFQRTRLRSDNFEPGDRCRERHHAENLPGCSLTGRPDA